MYTRLSDGTAVGIARNGPPVGRPIQYRLSGPDIQTVRSLSLRLAEVMASSPDIGGIVYDWNAPGMEAYDSL